MGATKKDTHKAELIDAIELLTQDHADVKAMFIKFKSISSDLISTKRELADKICISLTKHTEAEEEIFYPTVRNAVEGIDDLVNEALVEHASAKELIAQIIAMDNNDELLDAKIKVLFEQIEHHVREEENKMFPKARKASLDMIELGEKILKCKRKIKPTLAS